jgi:hypothetical protein
MFGRRCFCGCERKLKGPQAQISRDFGESVDELLERLDSHAAPIVEEGEASEVGSARAMLGEHIEEGRRWRSTIQSVCHGDGAR